MTHTDTATTQLGESVLPLTRARPGVSGIVPLREGRDAFAARVLLADAAERTLDVQYYIWHRDMSGTLLFEALRRAADRGVRVRLLLDDNNTLGLDTLLAALDAHPNIEVRLFNPFPHRRWRLLDYVTDFARLNRRMHNKSFTADEQVTIIGGRNVGDEYFDAGHDVLFVDLDVMAIGPVVHHVSRDFDRYWRCESARPASHVLRAVTPASISSMVAAASRVACDPAAVAYIQALAQQPFVRDLLARQLHFEWATTTMVSDDPAKGLGRASEKAFLWPQLKVLLGAPTQELQLISAYFVPGGAATVEDFVELSRRGLKIEVLTNSLEATDVAVVHAGYAKHRKPLLEGGVALFEMKRGTSVSSMKTRRSKRGSGSSGSIGSSSSSLHAKTFSVDRSRAFVGSFNFDPRSARLNTELGFVIESPAVAQAIADAFTSTVRERAYEVRLDIAGRLEWVERLEGMELVHHRDPGAGYWRRLGVTVLSVLPIEWLL